MQIKKDGDAMRRKMTYLIYIFLIAILFSNIIIPNYSFAGDDIESGENVTISEVVTKAQKEGIEESKVKNQILRRIRAKGYTDELAQEVYTKYYNNSEKVSVTYKITAHVNSSSINVSSVFVNLTDEEDEALSTTSLSSSSGTSSGGGSSNLNINTSDYKPGTPTLGTTTSQKVGIILSALQAVGAIGIVVAIALIGFDMILGSASEKAISKEKMIGILMAAIMITGGTTIAKVIVNIANGF